MTQHDDRITLRQILDMATEAIEFTQGCTEEECSGDRLRSLAIERLLLNIGEASIRLSATVRDQLTEIPWPQIVAFRNRVVHGYDMVDHGRVWHILQTDLPLLITELEKLNLPSFG